MGPEKIYLEPKYQCLDPRREWEQKIKLIILQIAFFFFIEIEGFYLFQAKIAHHPKIRYLPADHDPRWLTLGRVPKVHAVKHPRRQMYSSKLDERYA